MLLILSIVFNISLPQCVIQIKEIKGATQCYFTHYSCVVIILFDTGLGRSAFFTICFRKLVFHLPVLSVFFVESNVLNQDIKTAALKYVIITQKGANCYVIFFSLYKNLPSKYQIIYKNSIVKNMLSEKFWNPKKFICKIKTVKKKECEIRYHKIAKVYQV